MDINNGNYFPRQLQPETGAFVTRVKLTMHMEQNSEIKSSLFRGTEKPKKKLRLKFQNQVKKFTVKFMASISTTVS